MEPRFAQNRRENHTCDQWMIYFFMLGGFHSATRKFAMHRQAGSVCSAGQHPGKRFRKISTKQRFAYLYLWRIAARPTSVKIVHWGPADEKVATMFYLLAICWSAKIRRNFSSDFRLMVGTKSDEIFVRFLADH